MCNVKIFPLAKCAVLHARSLESRSCNAIHVVPSFLLEGDEGTRDNNDDARMERTTGVGIMRRHCRMTYAQTMRVVLGDVLVKCERRRTDAMRRDVAEARASPLPGPSKLRRVTKQFLEIRAVRNRK